MVVQNISFFIHLRGCMPIYTAAMFSSPDQKADIFANGHSPSNLFESFWIKQANIFLRFEYSHWVNFEWMTKK